MKKIATLALIMALLGFPAVNANADIFTLWENFPQFTNGENGFYTARHNEDSVPPTTNDLVWVSDYNFAGAGVEVKRGDTEPLISLLPSSTESAVLYGIAPTALSAHIYGRFDLAAGADYAGVVIGKVPNSDPSQFEDLFYASLTSFGPTYALFDCTGLFDAEDTLVFSVLGGQVYLQGTIDSTTVPVPGSLLLLGSGLLGMAGWRRRFWLK